jgi:hypothetical protein
MANNLCPTDSESSFFNYTNALAAERAYLLDDAHTDWKHKARLANLLAQSTPATSPAVDIAKFYFNHRAGNSPSLANWLQQLCAAEALWISTARNTTLPDFESTVLEYQSLSDSESVISPSPSELSLSSDEDDSLVGGGGSSAPVPVTRKPVDAKGVVEVGHQSAAHGLGPEQLAKALEVML